MSDQIVEQYKTCRHNKQCLHPNGPVLPLSEFYDRPSTKDGKDTFCKTCKRAYSKAHHALPKEQSGNVGELLLIHKLRSQGIYAVPGKSSEWRRMDVVAWGCIRIEVKAAIKSVDGQYQFGMGCKPATERERSDIVVLICLDDLPTFHVFPSDHPVFYHSDGTAKKGVCLSTRSTKKSRGSETSLDLSLMLRHQDRWDLLEVSRNRIINALTRSFDDPREGDVAQLSVFIPEPETNEDQLNLFGTD